MQHHMFKLINEGNLFFAPLQNPKRILDIGTGSGIWPMEMGMLFLHLPPDDLLEKNFLLFDAGKVLNNLLTISTLQPPSSLKPRS